MVRRVHARRIAYVKLLFILAQTSYIRHFESVVLALADRGHELRLAVSREGHTSLAPALAAHPRISQTICPTGRADKWREPVETLRSLADYVHYLEPAFLPAEKLRTRAFRNLAKSLTGHEKTHIKLRCPYCKERIADDQAGKLLMSLGDQGLQGLRRLLQAMEASVRPDSAHEQFLRAERADAVLVTPLINHGSGQSEWVKAARVLKTPVGFPVFSWDNLTTKGLIHEQPDRLFVWNEIQRKEAADYHGIPREHVVVTGAPRFDDFFSMAPSTGRATFCRGLGLDSARTIITYLCSSEFVSGREVEFVRQWIDEVRQDPALEGSSIVIRPHPRSLEQWRDFNPSRGSRVAVTTSGVMNADQLLYDSLYHSAAIVGLNTSAQIEAGILGKPVYTMLAPGFERGQQGTLHFQYLLAQNGGFVEVADSFDSHRSQLAQAVAGRVDRTRVDRFIESFIRPSGLHLPATPIMADAIEALAS